MIEAKSKTAAVGRLLWPECLPVTAAERARAAAEVSRSCPETEARQRLARIEAAANLAELSAAVRGKAEVGGLPVLQAAPRVGVAVWVLLSVVNLVVYLGASLNGGWDGWWPVWPVAGVGLLVLGLWTARAAERRLRRADG